jgi:endogenous inhibitor of DNA gyrase (YacG/DUF329 family)
MQTKCPGCGKVVAAASSRDAPDFPFCNSRCRMADLDRWFTGEYSVPGDPVYGEMPAERDAEG